MDWQPNPLLVGKCAPAKPQPEPQPEPEGGAASSCWVCLSDDPSDGRLLHNNCACRGDAGYVHLPCLVQLAKTNAKRWTSCPTCKQAWTGRVKLGLCSARFAFVEDRPKEDRERLVAACDLTEAMGQAACHRAEFNEALQLGRETLTTMCKVFGQERATINHVLDAMSALASVHSHWGDHAAALTLHTDALVLARRVLGDSHQATLHAIGEIGGTHTSMGSFKEALPLLTEAVDGWSRHKGPDHPVTLICLANLGNTPPPVPSAAPVLRARRRAAILHMEMGNDEQCLSLLPQVCRSMHPWTVFSKAVDRLRAILSRRAAF